MTLVLQLLSYSVLALIPLTSGARAFLGQSDTIAKAWTALNFSLGCGEVSQDVQSIQVMLTPMWRSMPQDSDWTSRDPFIKIYGVEILQPDFEPPIERLRSRWICRAACVGQG